MDTSLAGMPAVVVGGSRGLGRGAAESLAARGAKVVVVGRDERALASVAAEQPGIETVAADASDEAVAERVLRERAAQLVVICAGAAPVMAPLHELTWDQFEVNWNADAKIAFVWLRQALRRPLDRDSHVIVISSGAAVQGSPMSGGYASAKRAQWFMADYAAAEIKRAGLGIRVHCVLPILNPNTELGRAAIAAYARREGVTEQEYARRFEPQLTPAIFGTAIADLAANPARWDQLAYRLGGRGLIAA
jgi:NAD(P)-dependent dehydrogenase (short-subunit alcohol dehydrogenase family)